MRKGQNRGALLVLCLCVCYIMHEKNEDESEILNDSWHKLGNFVFFFYFRYVIRFKDKHNITN
jgi:hypothetical protein